MDAAIVGDPCAVATCASADLAVRDHADKELKTIIKPVIPDPGESPPFDDYDYYIALQAGAFRTKLVYIFPDNY
jgi:hypothetical protein